MRPLLAFLVLLLFFPPPLFPPLYVLRVYNGIGTLY
jgi:hypothetical protein